MFFISVQYDFVSLVILKERGETVKGRSKITIYYKSFITEVTLRAIE